MTLEGTLKGLWEGITVKETDPLPPETMVCVNCGRVHRLSKATS